MSYQDFLVDLPGRCIDLLDAFTPDAISRGREVTLLLMAASTAFLVPKERLSEGHPAGDRKLVTQPKALKAAVETTVERSRLFCDNATLWRLGEVSSFGQGPNFWPLPSPLSPGRQVSEILAVIRNALAHGNMETEGSPDISHLLFYAEKRVNADADGGALGYKYLSVSVDGFWRFLHNWFAFLESLGVVSHKLSYRDVLEALPTTVEAQHGDAPDPQQPASPPAAGG